MFRKAYARFHMSLVRYLYYTILKKRDSKLRRKGLYKDVIRMMKGYEAIIFKDDGTLTKEATASKSKNTKKLINAFTENHKHNGNEDHYYVQVAKHWLVGYKKKFHLTSIVCISIFLFLWLSPHAFGIVHISGIWAVLYFIGLFFSPVLGLLASLYGKGWKRWLLALVNVILIFLFIIIMA